MNMNFEPGFIITIKSCNEKNEKYKQTTHMNLTKNELIFYKDLCEILKENSIYFRTPEDLYKKMEMIFNSYGQAFSKIEAKKKMIVLMCGLFSKVTFDYHKKNPESTEETFVDHICNEFEIFNRRVIDYKTFELKEVNA